MLRKLGVEITEKPKTFTALILVPVMIFSLGWACNTQSTFQTIDSILAQVAPAIQIVVSLLPLLMSKNIPANIVSGINAWAGTATADVNILRNIIAQYQGDLASGTAQQKINAAIQTTERDILQVLTIARVLDATTQQKITAIVTAIGAAIVSVENIVNNLNSPPTLKRAAKSNTIIKSGADFKAKFNVILHLPTGDPAVDAATQKLNL